MDIYDFLKLLVPIASFVAAVVALLRFAPWPAPALLTRERKQVKILDVVRVSHDTKRFRISLGEKGTVLGLPVGKHIAIYAPNPGSCLLGEDWNGKPDPDKKEPEIDRRYVPITGNETMGYFDLLVKIYRPGKTKMADGQEVVWEHGGKMGAYLDKKSPGDYIDIRGPFGNIEYLGRGMFGLSDRAITVKHVGMLAGGTGITPMLQILRAAVKDKQDTCRFTLIFANKTEDDIIMQEVLDSLELESKGQINVVYTLDFPPAKWKGEKGFMSTYMMKRYLPPPRAKAMDPLNPLILMCGPQNMVDHCRKTLEPFGYPKSLQYAF